MPETRLTSEKDGLKVEMVVTFDDSTVKVGFLITNNRGDYGYCKIKYWDDLGNQKEIIHSFGRTDVNVSTGPVLQFSNPKRSFNACFDILEVQNCPAEPRPWIEEVYVNNVLVWSKSSGQIKVPVYGYNNGLGAYLFRGGERSNSDIVGYPWPAVKIKWTCCKYGGRADLYSYTTSSYAPGSCIDQYTSYYINASNTGGEYIFTDRTYRNSIDDFCLGKYQNIAVSVIKEQRIYDHTNNFVFEYTVPADANILGLGGVSPLARTERQCYTEVYHNNELIWKALRDHNFNGWPNIILKRNFKAGDKIVIKTYSTTGAYFVGSFTFKLVNLTFLCNYSKFTFKLYANSYKDIVEINALLIPSEVKDMYIQWLKSRGIDAFDAAPPPPPPLYF